VSDKDARYNVSAKGRARQARYQASEKGKARIARYRDTERGQLLAVTAAVCNRARRAERAIHERIEANG